jgi:hypothetical protein
VATIIGSCSCSLLQSFTFLSRTLTSALAFSWGTSLVLATPISTATSSWNGASLACPVHSFLHFSISHCLLPRLSVSVPPPTMASRKPTTRADTQKKPAAAKSTTRVDKRPPRGYHTFKNGMLNVAPKGDEQEL